MTKDVVKVSGSVKLIIDRDGKKEIHEYENLVVNTGKALMASRLASNTDAVPSHMAMGGSDLPTTEAMTALGAEVLRSAITSIAATDNVLTIIGTLTATGSVAINEYGIFNASSGGDMLARFVASTIDLSSGHFIDITWSIQFGD